jgi:hypothetical protein
VAIGRFTDLAMPADVLEEAALQEPISPVLLLRARSFTIPGHLLVERKEIVAMVMIIVHDV